MSAGQQPFMHDLVICLAAPTVALSAADGQIRATGAQGVLHADIRVLSRAEVRVAGREPEPVAHGSADAARADFVSLVRGLGDSGPDPTVRLERRRVVTAGRVDESMRLVSDARATVGAEVELTLEADLTGIEDVKHGHADPPAEPEVTAAGASWTAPDTRVTVAVDGDAAVTASGGAVSISWLVTLAPHGGEVTLRWSLQVDDAGAVVVAAPAGRTWDGIDVTSEDRRLGRLVTRSLDDLHALRMTTAEHPDEVFLGAGAPWYLTLFGRDSIWAARMLLPVTTRIAGSTLRLLAEHQGARRDPATGEAPGKILHELRRGSSAPAGRSLPPLYFGTVDATALWIALLHDAWRWGLPEQQVRDLLPPLRAALGWLRDHADADGDGFLEYVDESGHGLANQGWKDSSDAIRFADGSQASAPIALCEVQGYAHEAALAAASLLDAFGDPGGDEWRRWAAELAARFREQFWVDGPHGRFPALALDRDKRRVDSLTSNIGHLLGTGLLDEGETDAVAALVTGGDMDGGFGLRTMSDRMTGFAPLSYHCGSVWPHDTAIVVHGLVRSGHANRATAAVSGVLAAAEAFGYRLPELWSGDDDSAPARPVPYPAACRPQAWSAAASVALVQAALGLQVDVPARRLTLRPPSPSPVGALRVEGIRVGDETVAVEIDASGKVVDVSGTTLDVNADSP